MRIVWMGMRMNCTVGVDRCYRCSCSGGGGGGDSRVCGVVINMTIVIIVSVDSSIST